MDAITYFLELSPFRRLPDDCLKRLSAACRAKKFAAKQMIFAEGDEGDYGFAVLEGHVCMLKSSANGKEFIVELLPEGELFGVIALLEERAYPLTARAQRDCEVLIIPKPIVTTLAGEFPELHHCLLGVVAERLRSSHNVARFLAHEKVEVRIAATLLALIPQFRSSDGKIVLQITRQELADLTGTTIETATRVTKSMEREGSIAVQARGQLLLRDVEALRELAQG